MTTLASIRRAAPALAAIVPALLSQAALAQGFDKINTTVTNVNTILVTISIAVVTIAIIWAGFKMIFQGARLADVAQHTGLTVAAVVDAHVADQAHLGLVIRRRGDHALEAHALEAFHHHQHAALAAVRDLSDLGAHADGTQVGDAGDGNGAVVDRKSVV